jgi:benzoyl-CoA reductase/2-hydroxyglutaryl-CoA dehydratase subunit BcrC/BadD/HgdB
MPVFLVSEIDQLTCVPYIDAVESFGLPADTCPVPSSECGALVIDALPHMGSCFISSSMPCDGSTMASSYMSRRFPDLPVFHLTFPVRYEYEETVEDATEDVKACIRFVEQQTGAKWNWDAYFTNMKRFNQETAYELEKWEVNKTNYPQIIGPCYELFRKWNYEMDGGADPRVIKTCKKVNKIMLEAYERKEEAWRGKMKYRGIVWSCPAHYYANFSNWLANCWGIDILVEMESLNFTKPMETEDKEKALQDLSRLYERMVMRRHTNGGYHNVVDELWRQAEAWRAEIIIMYQNVACKNMATLQGILDEQAREKNYHMIWIEHDLMDPRTVSRKTMRGKVNEYMRTVMKAYENGETAWPERKMKHRAIVWSCPAHYYANFSNWLANCWGIDVLVEMESLNFTKHLETEDKEEALRDLARLYERMVMRRHTNGGYQNVVDECWAQCEAWNAKLVIMYQNVACKNMATVQGILDEQGRARGYDLIWIEHDLMDPRTVSRRTMRDKVNEYMRTVMKAEPVDPSLVEFEDEVCM